MNNLSAYLLGVITSVPITLFIVWWAWNRLKRKGITNLAAILSKLQGRGIQQNDLVD